MSAQVLYRAFASQVERTGARQLTGRLVPYNDPTDVLDELPDGKPDFYREGFRPGAFAPQVNNQDKGAVRRISLIHRHEGGLGFLGPFVALREEPDGLWGDAKVITSRADDVEDLLSSGVGELSVEFHLPKDNHTEVVDGVRWRVRAHLHQVALEARGAYRNAQVLAYRAEADEQRRLDAEAQAKAAAEQAQREAGERAEREAKERAEEIARQMLEADKAAAVRHERFQEMAKRLDAEKAKQEQYIKQFGLTRPSSYR